MYVHTCTHSYLLNSVHPKVYPAICGLHKKQEAVFTSRCQHLKGKLTAQFVGLPDDFQCEYNKTLKELNKMDSINSPLEGLYIFQDALVSVSYHITPTIPTYCTHPQIWFCKYMYNDIHCFYLETEGAMNVMIVKSRTA